MFSPRSPRLPGVVSVLALLAAVAPAAGDAPAPSADRAQALALYGTSGILLIPDATNLRVMAFDAVTGDLVDADFVPADSDHLVSPIEAIAGPDGDTLLVSDLTADAVFEYDLATGAFLRLFAPAGGVDNDILNSVRGIELRGEQLLVTSGSPNNEDAVARFDRDGVYLGNFVLTGAGGLNSPWDVAPVRVSGGSLAAGEWLVSGSDSDRIHRYAATGAALADFATIADSPQQVEQLANGNVLVANYSGTQMGVVELSASAAVIGVYAPATLSAFRGVHELPGGTLLATTGTGVYEIDRTGVIVEAKITGVAARFVHRAGGWTPAASLPALAARGDVEMLGHTLYLLGFRASDGTTDGSVWAQDLITGVWTDTGVNLPTPVSNYTIAPLTDPAGNLAFFLFGGRDASGACTTAVQAYYPVTGATASFAVDPWPGSLGGVVTTPGAVAVVGNKAFLWGGFCSSTPSPYTSDQTWIFDPWAAAGTRWTAGPSLPARGSYQTPAVVDGRIYSIGGDTFDGAALNPYATVFRLDPGDLGAGWQARASLPTASSGVAGCDESQAFGFDSGSTSELAGSIVLAGCGQWGIGDSMLADSFLYRVASDSWSSFAPLETPRRNHAAALLPTGSSTLRLWVGGGVVPGAANQETALAEVYVVRPSALFADGFESGGLGAWSSHQP